MMKIVFLERAISRTQVFDWICCFREGCISTKSIKVFWMYSTEQKWGDSKSMWFGKNRINTNHLGSQRETMNFFWIMPGNFKQIYGHKPCVSKVCPTPVDSRAETPSGCSLWFAGMCKADKNSFKNKVTNHKKWCMVMTPKLDNNHHNGKHLHHHDPRNWTKFNTRQRWCLSLFWPRRYCAPWICFTRPNCKPAFSFRSTKKSPLCSFAIENQETSRRNVVNSSHDTPRHSVHLQQQLFANHHTPRPHQSPYSPDMTLCDVFLFPQINIWKGKCFEDAKMIKLNVTQ